MKNIIYIIFISLTIYSCKKEYPYPSKDYEYLISDNTDSEHISQWGKFLLIDAVMFVQNHETGEKYKFNHFDSIKNSSSLRWGGSLFEFENIYKDSTTYSFYKPNNFPGYGRFILNGDTSKHYAVYYYNQYKSIVEDPIYGQTEQLLGGSARPFSGQILNYDDKTIFIQIQEVEGSIDGYNCKYWTQLTLKKIEEW